jgi:isocitrate/isopropylmalate dehydrogenase
VVAGEKVLDSIANPAMAILGFLMDFELLFESQLNRKRTIAKAERTVLNFETILKMNLTKDITFKEKSCWNEFLWKVLNFFYQTHTALNLMKYVP